MTEPKHLRELVRLFAGLEDLHGQLVSLTQLKTDAMRRADLDGMTELNQRELALVRRIEERDGQRRALMESIGADLGIAPKTARVMTVSQLAVRLPEPARTAVSAAAGRLREGIAQAARANRVSSAIARDIVGHLKWVFASVRPREDGPAGYTVQGTTAVTSNQRIFDAVG